MLRRWIGLWLIALAAGVAGNVVTKAYVQGDHLMLLFARPFSAGTLHAFHLDTPQSIRYVFDLAHTRIGSSRVPKGLHHPRVRSFRLSQYRPDTVRIVIETDRPYAITHRQRGSRLYAIALPSRAPKPPVAVGSLFAGLEATSSDSRRHRSAPAAATSAQTNPSRTSRTPPATRAASSSRTKIATKPPAFSAAALRHRYRIVIDPGHGGHDAGAHIARHKEKYITLQIALRVRTHLRRMGFEVLMTRQRDVAVPLRERTRFANRKRGDVFVSIHANAIGKSQKRSRSGVETYFLQITRSERARRVAARENSVVLRRKDRLSQNVILNAVMTGPKIVLSNKLAIDIQRYILGSVHTRYRDVKDGGVRPAPFWVLVGAEMPAVLVEVGYLSNPHERRRLLSARYQELIARGIAQGIANYLRNRERELE